MSIILKPLSIYKINRIIYWIISLGFISLFLENSSIASGKIITIICHILDDSILILFTLSILSNFINARHKIIFLRKNYVNITFLLTIIFGLIYLLYNKYYNLLIGNFPLPFIISKIILFINILNLIKEIKRVRKVNYFFEIFAKHPAQTLIISFLLIIFTGTLLLMTPLASAGHIRIGFINALFTATSATCVTGLTVLDTATKFSLFGKIIILILIQIGGLGIMLFSFFGVFFMSRRISLAEKLTLSYALNQKDIESITGVVRNIILTTFTIECLGAVILFWGFKDSLGYNFKNIFFAIFHSISAFCNAGFALFSDNLESYKSHSLIILTISGLIILGGISFAVINNLLQYIKHTFRLFFNKRSQPIKITINTRLVLIITAILLVSGTLLIYNFEHKNSLLTYDIKTQYLSAFFQTVTLRTAGFNSINMTNLQLPTYLIMILFMFIGGAAGSTAGGIKVNTIGVIFAAIKSILTNRTDVVIQKHSIPRKTVTNAFVLLILASLLVFVATITLTLSEKESLTDILFEVVSAFGTVGVSTGITPHLTNIGKLLISLIMLIGRVGPLTLITALAYRKKLLAIRYPEEEIVIG